MARINEVADRAGVSTATVSRALNGKGTVDSELVARVVAAAAELGYRPNGPARNLRRQETTVLALIISDVENPFFTAISRGVEDVAHAAGYSVVLCNSDDDPDKERAYVGVALREQVAGVLLSPTGRTSGHELLRGDGTPVVALDRPLPGATGDAVLVDTRPAARQATLHLVEQGYRRVGCITGPSGISTAEARLAGYRDGLRAAKLRSSASLVRRCDFKTSGARQAARSLLGQPDPPDALLVANNAIAIGALEALAESGLRPGADVGLVSFDDAPWAKLLDPPLSVVAQPAYDMGTVGAQLLLGRIGGERLEATTTTLSAHLVERGSSSPRPR
ncbi:LacI family transcriptional regulator [Actinopolyspora erythraea]|uniref:LacI family transcriptional regulator n=1 Tax=Actinopolyspora erythraea TaxID=414996 RepID=A0A099D2S8_9ACTN|nr:LacI family DNA-binding transcriptional regulator [Actinopolyspora erythraea]ASU79865.1 LacI family transcriptional regulator [Actinopolyspora erythraea]KGI79620.1 LacI family transcriptional regulator [Actinopolyspora erythraea]